MLVGQDQGPAGGGLAQGRGLTVVLEGQGRNRQGELAAIGRTQGHA